ncbi:MAG: HEAT repeat domain-containing protein [bacterium]
MDTFDELSERLARGADADQRIDAAQRLAELDDPRVAPTLARALDDRDARVRERVEELLSQFCRSDESGNLRALLAEAERVSAALAAEVSRLRGELPAEAEPASVEPVEPPEHYGGDCAVIRLDARPADLKRACQAVAKAIDQALFTVTRELHRTKGFLAHAVPAETARPLVHDLERVGLLAGAVPTAWVPETLELVRVRAPQFASGELRGTIVPAGEAIAVPWETVELVAAGRIEVELKREKADEDWSPFTRPLRREDGKPLHETGYEYALEVYGGEPLRRLRLLTHELDFEIMQRRPSDFSSVARLAREIVRHADRRCVAAGVRRLAELDRENWDDLTFLSPAAFEAYLAWQRLLLRLEVPLPRDRY